MEYITRKFKKNNYQTVTYPVYTQEEADDREIKYSPWRECGEGQVGLSDDGYVAECIYVRKYKDIAQVTFPYGRQWIGDSRLRYEPHRDTGEYSQIGTRSWGEMEAKKT